MSVASAEDASAVPTATVTAEPTATPEPTVKVERTLTLWFGGKDSSGNVYMTHNKTDRVFTVSGDTYAHAMQAHGGRCETQPTAVPVARRDHRNDRNPERRHQDRDRLKAE